MDLISESIEEYCLEHTTNEADLWYQLERETHLKVLRPRMLSGKIQGLFLEMLIRMKQPKHILEIGTYTAYSTLFMANGLTPEADLHSIEINMELEDMIKKYVQQHPHKDQIHIHFGDALKLIQTLNYRWDFVFMDAEKTEYLDYYKLLFSRLNVGGFILADNVLWSGKVIEEVKHNDTATKAILDFNQAIQNDNRVKNVLLPIRDGLMLIEKIAD